MADTPKACCISFLLETMFRTSPGPASSRSLIQTWQRLVASSEERNQPKSSKLGERFCISAVRGPHRKLRGKSKESGKLRSIPVDRVVFDEIDLMDPAMVFLALQRLGDSEIKEEEYISSPTIPDFGIDRLYGNPISGCG